MDAHIEIPIEEIRTFCKKWRVRKFSLFGSVLRNDFRPDSDVDVLISFEKQAKRNLLNHVRMLDELRQIFGRDVDMAQEDLLDNPFRRQNILKSKKTIYAA
jgi:uncharacterized protein